MKGEIYNHVDNQTLDILNQLKTFENSVNQQLVDKQSSNISTNRIILIVAGIGLLIGAFFYFSRKKTTSNYQAQPLPHNMDNFNDEPRNNKPKSKGKSTG